VVPRGSELFKKLSLKFSEPGGIRIDDVGGVNDSSITRNFTKEVEIYSEDKEAHDERTRALLDLGKLSMDAWQAMYDDADLELKQILINSNFNPCRNPRLLGQDVLHDGYRVDLIYDVADAEKRATVMKADYEKLGYTSCKILSPTDVSAIDPSLKKFAESHSSVNDKGNIVWKNDSVALWRPGGCLNTHVFLPKFYAYLEKKMGQYRNHNGELKNCFHIRENNKVEAIIYKRGSDRTVISGLRIANQTEIKRNKHNYKRSNYVFCPGEAVGTLRGLDLQEPAYAGFAGPVLILNIPIPLRKSAEFSEFNHCMEVHQEGVVLAWQANIKNNCIEIGVGGTKAYYADQKPEITQEFALNRNLLQLNMINDVLPDCISLALGRDTRGQKLTLEDLTFLENQKIAERWVGTRAVAYDGFPSVGKVSNEDHEISNARCTTHLGSGGVSFAPAVVMASQAAMQEDKSSNELIQTILKFGNPTRSHIKPHKPADEGMLLRNHTQQNSGRVAVSKRKIETTAEPTSVSNKRQCFFSVNSAYERRVTRSRTHVATTRENVPNLRRTLKI
jgi:hypothetical protein